MRHRVVLVSYNFVLKRDSALRVKLQSVVGHRIKIAHHNRRPFDERCMVSGAVLHHLSFSSYCKLESIRRIPSAPESPNTNTDALCAK